MLKSSQLRHLLLLPVLLCLTAVILSSGVYLLMDKKNVTQDQLILAERDSNTFERQNSLKKTSTPSPVPTYQTNTSSALLELPLHTFQTFNNCGPATLAMNLSYYGFDISQQQLGDELRPYQVASGDNDDKSVTLDELAQKATELGLVSYYRPAGNIELLTTLVQNDIPVITRTWTAVNENIGHYRVVTGFDQAEQVLYQDDSLQGEEITFSYADFNAIWQPFNYEFLVVISEDKQAVTEQILAELTSETYAWRKALSLAETQLEENPNSAQSLFNYSVALYNLGRYQDSVEAYEASKNSLPPRTLWYRLEPLLAYYQLGEYQVLLNEIERILTSGNRAYAELYKIRGDIYLKQGNLSAAEDEYQQALFYNKNYQPARQALSNLSQ